MSLSCLMYFRQSSVFLANRLMDLVIIISMLPALQESPFSRVASNKEKTIGAAIGTIGGLVSGVKQS